MAQRLENVNIWIKLQCEEKEEECSSTNKNQSKTGRSKNNKWNKNNTKKTTTTTTKTYSVNPIYATSIWRKPAGSFTCVSSERDLPALPTSILYSRAAIINNLITLVRVQMLWPLCPRLNKSHNDHSIEKAVVSTGQNTPAVLRTEK